MIKSAAGDIGNGLHNSIKPRPHWRL